MANLGVLKWPDSIKVTSKRLRTHQPAVRMVLSRIARPALTLDEIVPGPCLAKDAPWSGVCLRSLVRTFAHISKVSIRGLTKVRESGTLLWRSAGACSLASVDLLEDAQARRRAHESVKPEGLEQVSVVRLESS